MIAALIVMVAVGGSVWLAPSRAHADVDAFFLPDAAEDSGVPAPDTGPAAPDSGPSADAATTPPSSGDDGGGCQAGQGLAEGLSLFASLGAIGAGMAIARRRRTFRP